jgi:hypothetical protein
LRIHLHLAFEQLVLHVAQTPLHENGTRGLRPAPSSTFSPSAASSKLIPPAGARALPTTCRQISARLVFFDDRFRVLCRGVKQP